MFGTNVEPKKIQVSCDYCGTKCLWSIDGKLTLITTSQGIAYPANMQLWNLSSIDYSFAQELLRHGKLSSHSFSNFNYFKTLLGSKKP